jgi:hypothetical protein
MSECGRRDIRCEIHFADHAWCPPIQEIERRVGRWLQGVIPTGMSIALFGWKEKTGEEDFHDRFLLTDKGGMTIGAGFSADGPVYELADRVLVVHGDGRVEQI